jgi:hypothetical protein
MTIGIRTTLSKTKESLRELLQRRLSNSTKGLGYWGAYDAQRRVDTYISSTVPKL